MRPRLRSPCMYALRDGRALGRRTHPPKVSQTVRGAWTAIKTFQVPPGWVKLMLRRQDGNLPCPATATDSHRIQITAAACAARRRPPGARGGRGQSRGVRGHLRPPPRGDPVVLPPSPRLARRGGGRCPADVRLRLQGAERGGQGGQ